MTQLYEADFSQWAQQQADLCRRGRFHELDIEHLSEELEGMSARERRELVNRLAILLAHLLKWRFQPERRGNSWRLTIKIQRLDVASLLQQSPSLRARLNEYLSDAYRRAILMAAAETGLNEDTFPEVCPFSTEQLLGDHWPDAVT
jgi:hypothetical protein